jgi:Flp pilus assembly protein protease CpaA
VSGVPHFYASLQGFAAALGVGLVLFFLRTLGAGDAKFMAAIGAWAGLSRLPMAFLAMLGCAAENFSAVARQVAHEFPEATWLLFGGKADATTCARVAAPLGSRAINLAGITSLRQLMCLLKHCKFVLTNDTGPMHLAAAIGTRVAAIFGSTSPAMTGPGLPGDTRHRLVSSNAACSPCFLRECPIDFRCMNGISVSQVVSAVLELHAGAQGNVLCPRGHHYQGDLAFLAERGVPAGRLAFFRTVTAAVSGFPTSCASPARASSRSAPPTAPTCRTTAPPSMSRPA